MKNFLIYSIRLNFCKAPRKIIEPQQFAVQKVDDFHFVKCQTYEFLIKRIPQKKQIYKHQIDTPARVLKKPGIHIFPKQIPAINRKQKYQAILKIITEQYEKSFKNCKTPKQIFHMSRKVKNDIRKRLEFIGIVENKYRHYMLYQSYAQFIQKKTKQEYLKKGVNVNCLGFTIYPKGDVWMPTNEKYLIDFVQTLKKLQGDKSISNVLDIGCGSGVLSFLCKKTFKKAKITAFDLNQAAVDTTNITAAENKLNDIRAFKFDVTKLKEFSQKIKEEKISQKYDIITINPPWLHANKLPGQSELENGVYDSNGNMLESAIKLASQHLADNNSKIYLIYSDLNKILELEKKSVSQLCQQNSLLVCDLKERPLTVNLQKPSPLNQFKQKAKIQLFEIRKS